MNNVNDSYTEDYNSLVKKGLVNSVGLFKATNDVDEQSLDFFTYAEKYVAKMKEDGRGKSAKNYEVSVNNLQKFLGCRTIDFNKMTAVFFYKYHTWMLRKGLGNRGQELYLGSIRKIFNEAVLEYNDYDTGEILIRVSPFKRFKVPTFIYTNNAEKKALSVETIRKIFAYQPQTSREALAKDIYTLSFCLCGMNAADLYACDKFDSNSKKLTYYRAKTKSRRADGAEMQITFPAEVEHLLSKYGSSSVGSGVFNFSKHYANVDNFSRAVNRGLKRIGKNKNVGVARLTLYTARHSWATIAVNDLGIPEEQVDDCLAHAPMRKMLHRYVKKDWSKIDKTNRKVLDYVFGVAAGGNCRQLSLF